MLSKCLSKTAEQSRDITRYAKATSFQMSSAVFVLPVEMVMDALLLTIKCLILYLGQICVKTRHGT